MLTGSPERTRVIIHQRLWTLAGLFAPPFSERHHIKTGILDPIAGAINAHVSATEVPIFAQRERVEDALSRLEVAGREHHDPRLPIKSASTLLRTRIHPLKSALGLQGMIRLFQGTAETLFSHVRFDLYIRRGEEAIALEVAKTRAEQGDVDLQEYVRLNSAIQGMSEIQPNAEYLDELVRLGLA